MNTLKVNKELCIQCGTCINDCPMHVLGPDDENMPIFIKEKEAMCNKCGHCEASCAQQAIYHEGPMLKGSPGLTKQIITKDQISYHIRNRRSIRNYRNEPVANEIIDEIFDAVRYAPSGMNSQSVNWNIVHSKEGMDRLNNIIFNWIKEAALNTSAKTPFHKMLSGEQLTISMLIDSWEKGFNPIFYNAPHLAIAYSHKNAPSALFDSIIALSYLDMTLPVYKLGGCWAGFFHIIAMSDPQLAEKIGLPKDHIITGAIMFGYPKVVYHNIPKRNIANLIWN